MDGDQGLRCLKKDEYVKFKNFARKTNSPLMIYADFQSILISEDNGKQNYEITYPFSYRTSVVCSYGYKLARVDNKFNKPFKLYLSENTVYNFVNTVVQESKYYSEAMKKHFKQKTCND